jgi:hypothetical protein
MSFDRQDYAAMNGRHTADLLLAKRDQLETLSQAAVQMELLTGDANWDRFLSYVQSAIAGMEKSAEGFRRKLADPTLVNPDDNMRAKIALIECEATITAWRVVLELPVDIRRLGTEARSLLQRIEPTSKKLASEMTGGE